ncbi:MAG: aspartate kinase [Candidatus Gracilibacteria bacterium]|jgi:aspartate kinase
MGINVQKFGGTSVGGSEKLGKSAVEAMNAVADIVKGAESPVVVASALSGVTDQLLKMLDEAANKGDWQKTFGAMRKRHEDLIIALGIQVELDDVFKNLYNWMEGISYLPNEAKDAVVIDKVQVTGERLSNPILAAYLKKLGLDAEFVDASELIFMKDRFGKVDCKKTNFAVQEKLAPMINAGKIPVITGFLGNSTDGKIISLGRGGSDYTASIIGAALKEGGLAVDSIEIWTDVDGVFTADPKIVPNAILLEQASCDEVSQLANDGGKVLFPGTMEPAIRAKIPIKVRNTFNPEAAGTIVDSEQRLTLKAITRKKGVRIITVKTPDMFGSPGFLAKMYKIFENHGVSVDFISCATNEVSSSVNGVISEVLLEDLRTLVDNPELVSVKINQAVISLVGHGIHTDDYVSARFLRAANGAKPSLVSLSTSGTNLTIIVDEDLADDIVRSVHAEFFDNKNGSAKQEAV